MTMDEIKVRDIHGNYVWVAAKIFACANPDCKDERKAYTVPDDGFPITCGACGTIVEEEG
jgi:hypothetical protein